jgi:exopolysaccharide biosynthesis polyprenyl glycosylphosphotransferase
MGKARAALHRLDAAQERLMSGRSALLLVCDVLALSAAVLLVDPSWPAAGYAVAALIALSFSGRHRPRISMHVFDEIPRLAASALLPIVVLLAVLGSASRVVWLGVVSTCMLVTMRAGLYAALRAAHRAGKLTEPALIVGTGRLGTELSEVLQQHPDLGLRPVGFIGGSRSPVPDSTLPLLGTPAEICEVIAELGVRRVILGSPAGSDEALVSMLRTGFPRGVTAYVVPRMHELAGAIPTACMDEVWGIPLMPLRISGLRPRDRTVKRGFDLIVGTTILVALTPVLLILMVAQLSSCGRPILFRQERVTRSGRVIRIIKLRTIRSANPDTQWTAPTDDCPATARWLRSTHLDELPQLLNVIRGDMSLVGPRPERPHFASRFAEVIPRYDDRHRTATGMTGWAQVHGLTGDTSIPERVRFDNYYIEHWSLWLDVLILARTLAEPLSGPVRARRARTRQHR